MKQFKRFWVFYASAGLDLLIAFPLVLLIRLFWGRDLRWARGVLSCEIRPQSWAIGGRVDPASGLLSHSWPTWWPKGWYLYNRREAMARREAPQSWGGTSIGHGQFYGPEKRGPLDDPSSVEVHEDHHTAQAEAAQMGAAFLAHLLFVLALVWGHWIAALVLLVSIWTVGGNVLNAIGGWLVAILLSKPEGFYRGSAHEIGAFAVGRRYAEEKQRERDLKYGKKLELPIMPKHAGGL